MRWPKMNETHFLLQNNKMRYYYKTENIERKPGNDFDTVIASHLVLKLQLINTAVSKE